MEAIFDGWAMFEKETKLAYICWPILSLVPRLHAWLFWGLSVAIWIGNKGKSKAAVLPVPWF